MDLHDLHVGRAETTTSSRMKAVADQPNAISFAAMNSLMAATNPHLILNCDFTQYTVGNTGKLQEVVFHWPRKQQGNLKVAPNKAYNGTTALFIKYMMLITAGGISGDSIYVIADQHMKVGKYDVHYLPALSHSVSLDSSAYIVFSNTRQLPQEFYNWFILQQVIPLVNKIRVMSSTRLRR